MTTPPQGTPIEGAVALVTGEHRGFDRALVDELLARGARSFDLRASVEQGRSRRAASHSIRAT
jgi:NAD(P)-dependent dehydrogenase (short-subunit alcohol dehydrogenase family)